MEFSPGIRLVTRRPFPDVATRWRERGFVEVRIRSAVAGNGDTDRCDGRIAILPAPQRIGNNDRLYGVAAGNGR